MESEPRKGRGASHNPPNRFEKAHYEWDLDLSDLSPDERPSPRTRFYRDHSRSIVTENESPDVGFRYSINAYRGCEHGCAYCYARPGHEYLGLSAGVDFETKIFVKEEAPALLEKFLRKPSWKGEVINLSGVTDCYQPIERKLALTRRCLEVLARYGNPFTIVTKNYGVTRDIDVISPMARRSAAAVFVSVTTLDEKLCRALEPRTSGPALRLRAIEELSKSGIPVGVLIAPLIPGLNDSEIPAILRAVAEAGATQAGFVTLRLPGAVLGVFTGWLEAHRPESKERVLSLIRSIRGGKLNDARFGSRMRGEGEYAEAVRQLFHAHCRKNRLNERELDLTSAHFRQPDPESRAGPQLSLF